MSILAFECRRLVRNPGFILVGFALFALSIPFLLMGSGERSSSVLVAPLLVTWVAAGDLAESLRRGQWEVVLSRGPSLASVVIARWVLASAAGILVVGPGTLPALGITVSFAVLVEHLALVFYWSSVGCMVGLKASGAAAVLGALASTGLVTWWTFSGCARLFEESPIDPPWRLVTVAGHFLGSIVPLSEIPGLVATHVEWSVARVGLAGGLLFLVMRSASRRLIPGREEG